MRGSQGTPPGLSSFPHGSLPPPAAGGQDPLPSCPPPPTASAHSPPSGTPSGPSAPWAPGPFNPAASPGRALGSPPRPAPPVLSPLKLLQARTQSARVLYPHRFADPKRSCLSVPFAWSVLPAPCGKLLFILQNAIQMGLALSPTTVEFIAQTQIPTLSSCWDLGPPSHHPKFLPPRLS